MVNIARCVASQGGNKVTLDQHLKMADLASKLNTASSDLIIFHNELQQAGQLDDTEAYHMQGAARTLRLAFVHCDKLGVVDLDDL